MGRLEHVNDEQGQVGQGFGGRLYHDAYKPDRSSGMSTKDSEPRGVSEAAECSPAMAADIQRAGEENAESPDDLFDRMDKDHDGWVSKAELGAALQDQSYSLTDQQYIMAMLDTYDKLTFLWAYQHPLTAYVGAATPPGLSRNDLKIFHEVSLNRASGKSVPDWEEQLLTWFEQDRSYTARCDRFPKELFANRNDPLCSITPEGAAQPRGVGDCYFAAALISLAAADPKVIRDMIRDNHNGTYTVTFPGDLKNPVTVEAPTDAELAYYRTGSVSGTWAHVIQKAYGKYCNESIWRRGIFKLTGGDTDIEGAGGGSFDDGIGLKMLTGKGVSSNMIMMTSYDTLNQRLKQAVAEHRAITAGTNRWLAGDPSRNLPDAHVYAILAYRANDADPERSMITIRNPWVDNRPLTMTLADFCSVFSDVDYTDR